MISRRMLLAGGLAALAAPAAVTAPALAQEATIGSETMMQKLEAAPRRRIAPQDRVSVRKLKRRRDLRDVAPSVDIHAINFEFGSARIPRSQYRKVEEIAFAIEGILRRRPHEVFLIEGHTDAVGSSASNQYLSEDRAASLKRALVRWFDIPRRALETVGYGEEFLLVPTPYEEWRNRRVTLRRITDVIVR